MYDSFNVGNSVFKGFNDKHGIFLCGYEWGYSKQDQLDDEVGRNNVDSKINAVTTFSNKSPAYGKKAFTWKYDNRIVRWFDLFGHPLSRIDLGGNFEKCIIQTNWCNTQNYEMEGSYYAKLTAEGQVKNFLSHVIEFEPKLIMFFGSSIIDILQTPTILNRFCDAAGSAKTPVVKLQKEFSGRKFKIGFQFFEKCDVVSLPHPSSSRSLCDDYIKLFAPEIGALIQNFKVSKGLDNA